MGVLVGQVCWASGGGNGGPSGAGLLGFRSSWHSVVMVCSSLRDSPVSLSPVSLLSLSPSAMLVHLFLLAYPSTTAPPILSLPTVTLCSVITLLINLYLSLLLFIYPLPPSFPGMQVKFA